MQCTLWYLELSKLYTHISFTILWWLASIHVWNGNSARYTNCAVHAIHDTMEMTSSRLYVYHRLFIMVIFDDSIRWIHNTPGIIQVTLTPNEITSHYKIAYKPYDIDGLAQDCGNSSALAMELPQSCAKPSTMYLRCNSMGDQQIISKLL